jgi:N-formylglutamate deformylase
MPAMASSCATEFPGEAHADFVIGNRDHTTCSPALAQLVRDHLTSLGYQVSINHPYKGVELVRRFGAPEQDRHSVQIEVNRKLYMDEKTFELNAGYAPLRPICAPWWTCCATPIRVSFELDPSAIQGQ